MAIELHLHGRTGDGKTTLATLIAGRRGATSEQHGFVACSGAESHTKSTKVFEINNFAINDNPGLMETSGDDADEVNLKKIVNHARKRKRIHALVLVVNHQPPRFDSGMQNAVKLLINSFGKKIVGAIAIVYTRAFGKNVLLKCADHARQVAQLIRSRVNFSETPEFPMYAVEAHPDTEYMREDVVQQLKHMTNNSINDLLRWASNRPPISTRDAIYGMHEHQQKLLEAKRRVEEEQRQREAAVRAAEEDRRQREEAVRAAELERLQREREEAEANRREMANTYRSLVQYGNMNLGHGTEGALVRTTLPEEPTLIEEDTQNLQVDPLDHYSPYSLDERRPRGPLGLCGKAFDKVEGAAMGNREPGMSRTGGVVGFTGEMLDRADEEVGGCAIA